jgi:Arc/MetJ family transcription regulator
MGGGMKRTNIELDEKLISEGKKMTGLTTSKALVNYALKELIRRKNQLRILKYRGKVRWRGDLDRTRSTRG